MGLAGALGLASGALDFAGGVKSLFGKEKRGPDFNDQLAMKTADIENTADATMEVARKHGIHPLVLFGNGINSGFSPTFQYNNDPSGPDYEAAGQNFGRAAQAWATHGERGQVKALEALQLERAHLENQLLASQISQINRATTPARPGTDKLLFEGQGNSAIEIDPVRRAAARHAYLYDSDGRVVPILNPDAGDNEPMMVWDFLTHTAPAEFKNTMGRTFDKFRGKFFAKRGVHFDRR